MFLDYVHKHLKSTSQGHDLFRKLPGNPVFVRIDNVSEYYWNSDISWGLESFPNCVPPWDIFWMEWTTPVYAMDRGKAIVHTGAGTKFGVLVESHKGPFRVEDGESQFLKEFAEKAKWQLHMAIFSNISKDDPFVAFNRSALDSEGKHLAASNEDIFSPDGRGIKFHSPCSYGNPEHEENMSWMEAALPSVFDIAMLALSFCHCKNSQTIPTVIDAPLRRKREERLRFPVYKYYTLNISPRSKVLKSGRPAQDTQKHAFHICRGHFKDYGASGLFGKHKGLWWWDMHSRGDARRGEIRKDYTVEPESG